MYLRTCTYDLRRRFLYYSSTSNYLILVRIAPPTVKHTSAFFFVLDRANGEPVVPAFLINSLLRIGSCSLEDLCI